MRTAIFHAKTLKALINKHKIVSIDQLKDTLGTQTTMTIFRKLHELSYRTSYSHRGKFYTINAICQFNPMGLWSHKDVHFSAHGTLLETVKAFVNGATMGYIANELKLILHVEVKESLLGLLNKHQITREKISDNYIYFSINSTKKHKQLQRRIAHNKQQQVDVSNAATEVLAHELKAAIVLFFSVLNEKQRRLYAGLESLKSGYGGDKKIAELLGVDPHTVAHGRKEILEQDIQRERIRQEGAGRHEIKKNT